MIDGDIADNAAKNRNKQFIVSFSMPYATYGIPTKNCLHLREMH